MPGNPFIPRRETIHFPPEESFIYIRKPFISPEPIHFPLGNNSFSIGESFFSPGKPINLTGNQSFPRGTFISHEHHLFCISIILDRCSNWSYLHYDDHMSAVELRFCVMYHCSYMRHFFLCSNTKELNPIIRWIELRFWAAGRIFSRVWLNIKYRLVHKKR